MKKLLSLTALGLALTLGAGAHAAEDAKAPTKQQSKMATCNKDAGDMKGDERKAFMKQCLSASSPAPAASSKQTINWRRMPVSSDLLPALSVQVRPGWRRRRYCRRY